jgi:hypothetical protein
MKSIQEYWSESPETTEEVTMKRKLEQLELDGRRVVMEAKHNHSSAVDEQDSYIKGAVNAPCPSFSKIADHIDHVQCTANKLDKYTTAFNALFPTE